MGKPEIRFKGYTDEWEQRKLGDVTESIKNGYTYKADGSREHQYKITRIESISSGAINIEKLGSSDNVNENYKLEDGDILFSHINSLPYIANTAIYTSNLGEIYHGMNLLNIRAKHEIIDSHFLLHLLKKESSRNWFRIIAKPAVNQASISTTEVSSFVFMMPNMEEQKRISSVLDNIDNLLTLHQRKCDEVKSLKKYMLQKMFPQNEQKVPEIRFEGFTEAWEQRKLGDVAEFSKGSGYSKGDLIESGTPIILYGRLYTKYETIISDVDTFVEAKDGSVYSKGGEVIVPASGETAEDIARAASVDKSGILLGGDLNVVMPNEDINSAFLAISISNGSSQRELARKAQGKSVVHIHNEEIRNLIVPFPTKTEQNKIENYFADLDHLITLHQQKCEELKKIKKFMLQKMFV